MKKELLFGELLYLPLKVTFKMAVFTALFLLTAQSSFSQWSIIGEENQIASVTSNYTSIAVVDEVPYVVYVEGSNSGIAKVKRLNSGTWEQLGSNIASNVSYTRIYRDNTGKLYVSCMDNANGNKLTVFTYNDTSWEMLGTTVSEGSVNVNSSAGGMTATRSDMFFDTNNVPYITYSDNRTTAGHPYVKRFVNDVWETVGTSNLAADYSAGNSIVIDNDNIPYVTYIKQATSSATSGVIKTFRFINNIWEDVSPPNPVLPGTTTTGKTSDARYISIALDANKNPNICYFNKSNAQISTVIRYTKTTGIWDYIGTTSTADATRTIMINDDQGNLYNTYIAKGTSNSTIKVFKKTEDTVFTELTNSSSTSGIDVGNTTSAISNPAIAAGNGSTTPYIVYTKVNTSNISTPVVRYFVIPVGLTTNPLTNITSNSVSAGGNILTDGGTTVVERGIVYSTTKNPTLANTKVMDANAGIGSFTVSITGLNPSTLYYIRAYAKNGDGSSVSYGETVRLFTHAIPDPVVTTPKQMEYLNRGLIAIRKSSTQVFVAWRLLGNEPANIAFNLYRDNVKINTTPITTSTNFLDTVSENGTYTVKAVLNDVEAAASEPATVWANNQLSVPLQIPPGGTTPDGRTYTYTANDASVGDVDGDGEYEIFLKWMPTRTNENSGGYSGNQIFDCYKLDGTKLWRIDLGINMNSGSHYNQFMVYDFDGDGKAEIILKTADGTVDGAGVVIGNPNVDYRNSLGWVQEGPEFLTVFNGLTGVAMATVPYEPNRGATTDWGDNYGNRQDRFVSAVAYLDGARPSIIVGRGYYDKLVRAAYDWRDGQLTLRWIFDSKDVNDPANNAFSSQGNHQMTIGDVDGDGKDEVINGASVINDDGKRLWTYGYGHGDALHMSQMDPDRSGQQIWMCHEDPGSYDSLGLRLYDAKNGEPIYGVKTSGDVGRALAADIDPNHRGFELWGSSGSLYNIQDGQISNKKPTSGSHSVNHLVWWDGDLGRELLDGVIVDKWNPVSESLNRVFTIYNAAPVSPNNDTKKNPCLTADIFGDWREEIILRRSDNTALIIFASNTITDHRIYTLMHDPQYRTAIAWQNSGYNQPPHPSFFLGYDMETPPSPNIDIVHIEAPQLKNVSTTTSIESCDKEVTYVAEALGFPTPTYKYELKGATTATGEGTASGKLFNKGITNVTITASNVSGSVNYSFDVIVKDTIAPVITIPPSQNLCYSESYTIPALVAVDNCNVNSVSYSITGATQRSGEGTDASGNFNVGTSKVTWTAIDNDDNQTKGETTVIVYAPLTLTIPDLYAINNAHEKNTLYVGYGPSSFTVTATPNGGKAPYTYNWSNGQLSQSIIVNSAGTYTVIITDALGCQTSASIDINVINVQCGNSGNKVMICHNGQGICVSSNAVQAHLNHGDKLGSCNNTPPSSIFENVTIFPNPVETVLNVKVDKIYDGAELSIYNILARKVKSEPLTSTIQQMALSDLNRGVYFLHIKNGKHYTIKAIVKK